MSHERRTDKRIRINLPARWAGMAGEHESRIEDISVWGCFVNTTDHVEKAEIISIEIQLPSGEWLALRGEVTSYQPGIGFGMRFTFLTDDEESALRELIR